jgi:hypothetical protein
LWNRTPVPDEHHPSSETPPLPALHSSPRITASELILR